MTNCKGREGWSQSDWGSPNATLWVIKRYFKVYIKKNAFLEDSRRRREFVRVSDTRQSWGFMVGPDLGRNGRLLGLRRNAKGWWWARWLGTAYLHWSLVLRKNIGAGSVASRRNRRSTSSECGALAGVRQRALGQAYPNAVNIIV